MRSFTAKERLFASDVTFRGLHGCVAKQELNLFQLAAGRMT
jgi:hypothetical protein